MSKPKTRAVGLDKVDANSVLNIATSLEAIARQLRHSVTDGSHVHTLEWASVRIEGLQIECDEIAAEFSEG